jgi:hypothetical protein
MDLARILAQNIHSGSGNHGLSEEELYTILQQCTDIDKFAYSLFKCAEISGKSAFTTQLITQNKPDVKNFTRWHHIKESYNETWGFAKNTPGCYVYGLFEDGPNDESADFLDPNVFYIGESRATSRGCMLGRRADFYYGVINNWVSPMGNSQRFVERFGEEKIKYVYQAYLPMHPSFCKLTELELLKEYYLKYNEIPVCNHKSDRSKINKLIKSKSQI